MPQSKKIVINLMDDDDLNITYILYNIPNYPSVHQLPSQANNNLYVLKMDGEEPITAKCAPEDIRLHQNNKWKLNFWILIFEWKCSQRTNLEDIGSLFHQIRPIVSHLEVRLPQKPKFPKNIGDAL